MKLFKFLTLNSVRIIHFRARLNVPTIFDPSFYLFVTAKIIFQTSKSILSSFENVLPALKGEK